VFCLAVNNTGTTQGFNASNASDIFVNCTAYGNGAAGFLFPNSANRLCVGINSLSYGNTGVGFNTGTTSPINLLVGCAAGNNSTNYSTSFALWGEQSCITLTADPFTSAAGSDFSLNNNAGGGALCRAAGAIGAFPGISTTTTYQDIGAVQHKDPGGMLVHPGTAGGARG
jgi:hypothetical protein